MSSFHRYCFDSLILFLFILQFITSLHSANADTSDSIGFPENIDESKRPLDDRNALYMPTVCDQNELYYPGDQEGVYVCDCRPAYLYYPPDKKCYAAFEEGPCDRGKILQMPNDGFIPVCVTNRCGKGEADIGRPRNRRPTCVTLGKACNTNTQRVYGVNETTLKIECLLPQKDNTLNVPITTTTEPPTRKPSAGSGTVRPGGMVVVNPRFGNEDEATSPQDPIPVDIMKVISDVLKYIGPRLVYQENVCFPGCRRSIEHKCNQIKTN